MLKTLGKNAYFGILRVLYPYRFSSPQVDPILVTYNGAKLNDIMYIQCYASL